MPEPSFFSVFSLPSCMTAIPQKHHR
jgi:hypothetical protein